MRFIELIDIMSANGVESLADIARELDVSPQSVSNWKARNRVPYKYALLIQSRFENTSNGQTEERMEGLEKKSGSVRESYQPRIPVDDIPPFLMEEESEFSLAAFLMPVAQNLRFIIKSTVVMTLIGILIFLFSTLLSLISREEPEKIYETTAKIVIPGGISLPGGGAGGGATGILGKLGISVPSGGSGGGGPSPTSTLTSPSLYPEFLRTRSFAKRMLTKRFNTQKYGEQTLLEIALLEKEEDLNKPGAYPWQGAPQDSILIDRDEGLDTLVMQHLSVLTDTLSGKGMIEFSQDGAFQTITTRAIEPKLAVEIAYVVLDELQAFTEYFTRVDLDKTQTFIEQRLDVVEDEYRALEEEMKIFKESNRQISGISLQLQQERLNRDLGIYKGLYVTLYQNLEDVKIKKEYELSPTIQILDYPIAPLSATVIKGGSKTTQNPKFILLLAIAGFGFGVALSLGKGYLSSIEEEEKKRLKSVKEEAKSTLRAILSSIKISNFLGLKRFYRG